MRAGGKGDASPKASGGRRGSTGGRDFSPITKDKAKGVRSGAANKDGSIASSDPANRRKSTFAKPTKGLEAPTGKSTFSKPKPKAGGEDLDDPSPKA